MYTHVNTDAKNNVCLRLCPIYSNTYVANEKVSKANKELHYNFDRLLIEKLYVNNNEHDLDFEEGREGLFNISKLLKNHLNVLNDSHPKQSNTEDLMFFNDSQPKQTNNLRFFNVLLQKTT